MQIKRLKYFQCVIETGSIRGAAELLDYSPGSLSKVIQQLEVDAGSKLFIASGRGIVPTAAGRSLYHRSKLLTESHKSLFDNLESTGSVSRRILRIASFESFTTYVLMELSATSLSGYEMLMLERAPGGIEKALLDDEADIGITYAPQVNAGLDFLKVCTFEKNIYCKRNVYDSNANISMPFAVPVTKFSESPVGISDLDGWPAEVKRNIGFRFETLEASLESARRGLSAVFCPDFIIGLHNAMLKPDYHLKKWALPKGTKPTRWPIYLVKRTSDQEDNAMKKITGGIRRLCRS